MRWYLHRRWKLLLLVFLIGIGGWFILRGEASAHISLNDLAIQIARGEVERVAVRGDDLTIVYKDSQRTHATSKKEPGVSIFDILRSFGLTTEQIQGVNIIVDTDLPWPALSVSLPLILLVLLLIWLIYGMRSVNEQTKDQFKTTIEPKLEDVQTTLQDLGGIEEARKALQPVLRWLEAPQDNLGLDVPRGILIAGPTGVGKTALARTLAGESKRPLFVYNGAEFAEILVGMGSSRMRSVFAVARKHAAPNQPVVVFIDQLDLIAAERPSASTPLFGDVSEAAKTLATLLAELDDLRSNGRVYVVAVTSRPRVIDPSILGPGRLSLRINLTLPDEPARKEILEKLTRPLTLEGDAKVLLGEIAHGTKTFSGAELAQLVRWACEAAQKRAVVAGANTITKDDFIQAKARLLPQPPEQLPQAIYNHLNTRVTGQDAAKKRLAVAVSNHYLRLREATRFDTRSTAIKKANVLMIGPTGSGKTMLIEEIATYLQVPYVIFNATILTETGYTGASVEQMLYKLLVAADHYLRRAEYGIICIDEIDKLAFHQGERSRHTGGAVQQELLKLVEGTIVDVPKGNGERSHSADSYQFDTSNVLFVCLGAFNDIETVIAHRLQIPLPAGKTQLNLIRQVQPEDIITYGFLPELIGRFPVVSFTEPLTVDELIAILNNEENGLMRGYIQLLELQGYEPAFKKPETIELIAREAVRRKVGARGLQAIIEEILLDPMYKRPAVAACASGVSDERQAATIRGVSEPADHSQPIGFTERLLIDETFVKDALAAASQKHVQHVLTGEQVLEQLRPKNHRYAKEILAFISSQHYQNQAGARLNGAEDDRQFPGTGDVRRAPRQAVLLIDPFCHQRQRLVMDLASIWQVPLAVMRADQLERSMNGRSSSGEWISGAVQTLLEQCDYDVVRAQRGIVFIDDFDLVLSRVTIDPTYDLLSRQIIDLLRGQVLPLRTSGGQTTQFETHQIFLILGGDFRFTTSLKAPFDRDGSVAARYESDQLLASLREEFNLGPELLEHLYVAPLDLAVTESDLGHLIRSEDERVRQKYRPLVALHTLSPDRTEEEYSELTRQAHDQRWPIAEIGTRLEQILLKQLHTNGVSHDSI